MWTLADWKRGVWSDSLKIYIFPNDTVISTAVMENEAFKRQYVHNVGQLEVILWWFRSVKHTMT